MNILFVDQFGEIGGAQLCLLDLIPAVIQRGWRPYAAVPEGPLTVRLGEAGATVSRLDPGHYASGRKTFRDVIRFGSRIRALASEIDKLCARYAIGLIYVNGPRLLPAVALASNEAPVLFHAHSYLPKAYARHLARWAVRRRGATVVAVSSFVGAFYPNSIVIPAGVEDLRRERGNEGVPLIGVLGRIAPEKGQLQFVEAAKLLTGCRFIVCGAGTIADPAYERHVRSRARGLPIDFTGWQDDIGAVLAKIDVLAVPSLGEEGLGRVILEAFSAEVPVVAFASGGNLELIQDNITGFLVRPRTAEALAARIRNVLADPALLNFVAHNARAAWESNFPLTLYRDRMMEALALATKSGPAVRRGEQAPPRQPTAADIQTG
jgi:glycosyltransferase involved in cell wall biosynthesis